MTRRTAGALVLLVVAALLVVARATGDPGVFGTARAAPLPDPPPVGACLLMTGEVPAVIDCAAPHDLEVTAGVTADATPPSRSQCDAVAAEYLPPVIVGDWQVPVDVETAVLPAPPGQRTADRGWQACTVRPANGVRFAGSVRGMTLTTFRGDVFGSCFYTDPDARVPCSRRHAAELLGIGDVVYPDAAADGTYFGVDFSAATLPDAVAADLTRRCTAFAAAATGAADPTYGGELTVRLQVNTVVPTDVPGTVQVYVSCEVAAPPGRPLTASVIGLGDAPLPFG